jgi:heme/copper-type cytochrome/quinol oxidase subunit 3
MEKTWKPQVAGVLNIIGGIPMFFVFFWLLFLSVACTIGSYPHFSGEGFDSFSEAINTTLVFLIATMAYLFAILSGIYALQRKKWKWVIIGSAIAITFVLGVISLILVIKSRAEFV